MFGKDDKSVNAEIPVIGTSDDCTDALNILFVSQHYWPEPFVTSDICEELVKRGHSVTVLTGQPNYPEGNLYDGYSGSKYKETHNGVRILRCALHPRKTGPIHRVWNYYSFSRNASKLSQTIEDEFDVIYSYQTSPVMMAQPAIAYANRTKTPLFLHCVDIWPECLTAGGIKPGSAPYNYYRKVSRKIYSSADKLAVASEMFSDYLDKVVGVEDAGCLYLPQYAEDMFSDMEEDHFSRDRVLFPEEKINLVFAGNVGSAQSIDTIVRAASELKEEDILFHIVGSGSELKASKDLSYKLGASNVVFHGRKPVEEMPFYYGNADAMVMSFSCNPILAYTLPRKLQSYMAAGKPVIGAVIGASRRAIDDARCGICCDAEDVMGFAKVCRQFAALSAEERRLMGQNARAYYWKHFSKKSYFDVLENELRSMKGMKHGC